MSPLRTDTSSIGRYEVQDQGLTIFLTGESGSGKTTMLETAIQAFGVEEVLILDLENRLLPLRHLRPYRWLGDKPITHTSQVLDCVAWLKAQIAAGEGYPNIFAFDSFSEWSDLAKRELYDEFPKEKSFDRFDQLGIRGLDTLVAIRSIPRIIKIVNCTVSPSGEMGGPKYKYNIHGRVIGENLARKVDLLLHIGEVTFENTAMLSPDNPLRGQEGRPIRAVQTITYDNVTCKDSSRVLDPWEPTDWGWIISKILKAQKQKEE